MILFPEISEILSTLLFTVLLKSELNMGAMETPNTIMFW